MQKIYCKDCVHFYPKTVVNKEKNHLLGFSQIDGFCSEDEEKKEIKKFSKACSSFAFLSNDKRKLIKQEDKEIYSYFAGNL